MKYEHLPTISLDLTCKNIKKMIVETGKTRAEMARVLNVNRSMIYKWTSTQLPSIDNLVALAYVLECSVDDILVTY